MLKNNLNTQQLLEMMKQETSRELGIEIHSDMTSRNAGKIGGSMTQKLIKLGELKLQEMVQEQGLGNVEVTHLVYQNETNHQNQLH